MGLMFAFKPENGPVHAGDDKGTNCGIHFGPNVNISRYDIAAVTCPDCLAGRRSLRPLPPEVAALIDSIQSVQKHTQATLIRGSAIPEQWTPASVKAPRLTRQQRAVVRQFCRTMAAKNKRSRRDRLDIERRNAVRIAKRGIEADIYYLQDQGAGLISVRQVLRDHRYRNGIGGLKADTIIIDERPVPKAGPDFY